MRRALDYSLSIAAGSVGGSFRLLRLASSGDDNRLQLLRHSSDYDVVTFSMEQLSGAYSSRVGFPGVVKPTLQCFIEQGDETVTVRGRVTFSRVKTARLRSIN